MILFHRNIIGKSGQALNAFDGIYFFLVSFSLSPPCRALLETHIQRASYQQTYLFLDVQSHAWHDWKVADGGLLILSGLMLKLYDMN